jgi:hypothetical protein
MDEFKMATGILSALQLSVQRKWKSVEPFFELASSRSPVRGHKQSFLPFMNTAG